MHRHPPRTASRPVSARHRRGSLGALLTVLLLVGFASATSIADEPAETAKSTEKAAAKARYVDNGDGTVTDRTTGLMWEKKCKGCGGPHDVDEKYHWSGDGKVETIWDWLDRVNAEGGAGLAGHGDWRIPNIKELVSIIDYDRFDPALDDAFHQDDKGACADGCDDTSDEACSCTAIDLYWTATTFSDFPAHALIVDVGFGFVDDRLKTNRHHVRAVRVGRVPPE
jgi:hypothetical protein